MVRLISAIVAFFVAAALLIVGFTFKFFSGPTEFTLDVPISSSASYAVIGADVLGIHPGTEVVTASGASLKTVAYGSTSDVLSWLGGSSYVQVGLNEKTSELEITDVSSAVSTQDAPTAAAAQDKDILSPAGSDMWLGESTSDAGAASLTVEIGADESVIVASDGSKPLPTDIVVSWPKPKQRFLGMTDDILFVVGGIVLLAGILLYIWSLNTLRGGRGPRRRGRLPGGPRSGGRLGRNSRPARVTASNRRALGRTSVAAVGILGALSLGLSGCTQFNDGFTNPTPTPLSTDVPVNEGPRAVVTNEQVSVILGKVQKVITSADRTNDNDLIRTRLTGPALDARLARYAMRKTNEKIKPLEGIRANTVQLLLPQATELWPRSVLAVVKSSASATKSDPAPSMIVTMTQDSPRTNYKVNYLSNLQPKQRTPEVASAEIGTPLVALDTTLLTVSPNKLAATYADVLNKGVKSKFYSLFDAQSDQLRPTLETERKEQQGNKNVKAKFKDAATGALPVAFATMDAGALVAVQFKEVGTYTPLNNLDLKISGQLAALSGIQITQHATMATYGFQVLFYVPPVGSNKPIQLLAFTENLIGVTFDK